MTNNEIWQAVLAELELSISKANFNTWFKNTGILSSEEGHIMVCVPNTFTQAWIEKKHHHQIIQSLERVTAKPIKRLEYKIENIKNLVDQAFMVGITKPVEEATTRTDTAIPSYAYSKTTPSSPAGGFIINPKYSFDTFVVGKGTELAFAAAQAVTNKPGEAYNPLFIYGGVGLGKTHLLQAIGNHLLQQNPDINIMYASAERFTNDFIASMKDGTAKDFQNRYRHIDLLLIDDIQFIAGKDRSQESFFYTFNELHQANKQVVLTSDRPPKAIPALEDRLKSRFEWGMIVDVVPPDYETRVAILQKKCLERNYSLENKILETIAMVVQNNIRELEGALNKIFAVYQLNHIPPTVESVKTLLSSLEQTMARKSVTSKQLIEVVASYYNIGLDDITGKSREKKLSYPRQIIMFLLRNELKMSFPSIGDELGGRDHTTAMHANDKIIANLENDLKLKQDIEALKQRLYINNI